MWGIVQWLAYTPEIVWLNHEPRIEQSLPKVSSGQEVSLDSYFAKGIGKPSNILGEWPKFRGANSDNINQESVALANYWPVEGPKKLWAADLGEGHAGPAVAHGCVYLIDYDEKEKADCLRCLSLDTGQEIWKRWYHLSLKRNHGFSRTVPAVAGRYVVTMGPMCHLMCVDAITGDLIWFKDLVSEYKATVPLWFTGQCPMILDNLAIVAIGSPQVLILAIDCATGEVVWQTPNPDHWEMSHSSLMPMTYQGQRMLVYCAVGGIVGIFISGEERGQIAWKLSEWSPTVVAPSPVVFEDGRVFITAGYSAGGMMFQVTKTASNFVAQRLGRWSTNEGLASEQQTPILYQGLLFGILPKDAGELRGQFVCCDPNDCTKMVWTSGKSERFGLGPFLIADGKCLILNDNGVLTMIDLTAQRYHILGRHKVLSGTDAWGPLALVQGRLLLRDSRQMICLDLRQ